jgi:hypothetical protein
MAGMTQEFINTGPIVTPDRGLMAFCASGRVRLLHSCGLIERCRVWGKIAGSAQPTAQGQVGLNSAVVMTPWSDAISFLQRF